MKSRRATPRALVLVWQRRGLAVGAVGAVGAATGAVSAGLMPRGPVAAGPGLAVVLTGLPLGAFAGPVLRKRRAVVLVLLAHVAALELVR